MGRLMVTSEGSALNSPISLSATGQDEHPWLVKSSITARGSAPTNPGQPAKAAAISRENVARRCPVMVLRPRLTLVRSFLRLRRRRRSKIHVGPVDHHPSHTSRGAGLIPHPGKPVRRMLKLRDRTLRDNKLRHHASLRADMCRSGRKSLEDNALRRTFWSNI